MIDDTQTIGASSVTESTQDSPATEALEAIESEATEAKPVRKDDLADNIRELRRKNERAERERDEALRRLAEFESRSQSPSQPEDDDFTIGADELAEGKHLSKVARKIKKLEDKIKNYEQVSSVQTAEARLRSRYNDLDQVVSVDNLNALKDQYPEMYQTINTSSDLYSKGVTAYTMIKQLGLHAEDTYAQDRELVKRNLSKPRPSSSVAPQQGTSPLQQANAFANGLTAELKAQLYKEMQESIRNK